jgi:hypothetical protein
LQLRVYFNQPFESHLKSLFQQCTLAPFPLHQLEVKELIKNCPSGKDWTIWISSETSEQFKTIKESFAPGLSHNEFIFLLILIKKKFQSIEFGLKNSND